MIRTYDPPDDRPRRRQVAVQPAGRLEARDPEPESTGDRDFYRPLAFFFADFAALFLAGFRAAALGGFLAAFFAAFFPAFFAPAALEAFGAAADSGRAWRG